MSDVEKEAEVRDSTHVKENHFYPGLGRPCEHCLVHFGNDYDLETHKKKGCKKLLGNWRTSSDGSEWCLVSEMPTLASQIKSNGNNLVIGAKQYWCDKKMVYINRREKRA